MVSSNLWSLIGMLSTLALDNLLLNDQSLALPLTGLLSLWLSRIPTEASLLPRMLVRMWGRLRVNSWRSDRKGRKGRCRLLPPSIRGLCGNLLGKVFELLLRCPHSDFESQLAIDEAAREKSSSNSDSDPPKEATASNRGILGRTRSGDCCWSFQRVRPHRSLRILTA